MLAVRYISLISWRVHKRFKEQAVVVITYNSRAVTFLDSWHLMPFNDLPDTGAAAGLVGASANFQPS